MSWKHQYSDQVLDELIRSILPNKHDQFEEGSDHDPQSNAQTQLQSSARGWAQGVARKKKIDKQKRTSKQRKNQNRVPTVINLESDENELNMQQNGITKKSRLFQLDDQEIQYYKKKLNITTEAHISNIDLPEKQKDSRSHEQQKEKEKKRAKQFVPPVEAKKAPKYIYQYPPYPLGPTDTWPPKYPNSWKSFKMEMKQTRKLD